MGNKEIKLAKLVDDLIGKNRWPGAEMFQTLSDEQLQRLKAKAEFLAETLKEHD